MAKPRRSAPVRLSRAQTIAGWCYLPFYLVLLNVLLVAVFRRLKIPITELQLNLVYFGLNLLAVLLIFRDFLRQSFFGGSFSNYLETIILGFVFYYAGTWAVRALLDKLTGGVTIYNNETVADLVSQSRWVMIAVTVILAPIIEETLLRGLVFGSIWPASRPMAYLMSILIFTCMHNWQYLGAYPLGSVLLSCIPYLPASAVLCWTYERGGTIWAPITLHALINAMSVGLLALS